ncbi:MAG: hypothetical protein PHC65_02235 [Methanobacteriaceae archaeon]|nr:hypothetical protein [Methanobacteriaceae archaeon]
MGNNNCNLKFKESYSLKENSSNNNINELENILENDRILDDLHIKEELIKETNDFNNFGEKEIDNHSQSMIVFKLNNLSKNHKNLSNLIQPYNSNHNNNQFLLENDFLIEKADIKIDTSYKNIQFNNSYNQYKPNLDLDTFKIEKSENKFIPKKSQNPPQELSNINHEIIEEINQKVKKNPRITLWSPRSAAVLRYLRKTSPEFSISKEASLLIDNLIKVKYQDIWNLFNDLD